MAKTIKNEINFPVDNGNDYEPICPKNFADMIIYNDAGTDTTVAAYLDSLSRGKIPHVENVPYAERAGNIAGNYLTLNNAAMTGTPTAPTNDSTDTAILTCDYFNGLVRDVAGSTDVSVAKIIAAINGNPHFATETAEKISAKQNKNPKFDDLTQNFSAAGKMIYTDGNNLLATPLSDDGKKILAANDTEEFAGIIGANFGTEEFWDETEKVHWKKVGSPYLSTDNAKFDSALQCSAGNYIYADNIILGGKDFTVDLWMRPIIENAGGIIFYYGDVLGFSRWGNYRWAYVNGDGGNLDWGTNLMHVEYCYKHSEGHFYLFKNGGLMHNISTTVPRTARTIALGGAEGAISSFRLLDGVCRHTSVFEPPTSPYNYEESAYKNNHLSLLQF